MKGDVMEKRLPVMFCPIARENCKSNCVFYNREEGEFEGDIKLEVTTVKWDPDCCRLVAALNKIKG